MTFASLTVGTRERDGAGIDGVGPVTDASGSFADDAQPQIPTASRHQCQREIFMPPSLARIGRYRRTLGPTIT